MHLHSKPYAKIAIHERTEPFSLRLKNWAKEVEDGAAAPFRGMDDTVWFAKKYPTVIQINRTDWHWVDIAEAADNFDLILKGPHTFITSINL